MGKENTLSYSGSGTAPRDVALLSFRKVSDSYHVTERGLEPMYIFIAGGSVYIGTDGTKTTHCLDTI